MRLELVTAPAAEPLTLAEAKAHLRVTSSDEDALVTRLIAAARRQVEATLRRRLITQTWRLLRNDFGAPIVLSDLAPAQSIVSVKYLDTAGALQTLATSVYQLVKEAPPRLVLAYDQAWPDLRGDIEGVRIEVISGYGAAGSDVPQNILAAMLLLIGHWYENRETVNVGSITSLLPYSVEALLSPHAVAEF